jgi:hypothetical protein
VVKSGEAGLGWGVTAWRVHCCGQGVQLLSAACTAAFCGVSPQPRVFVFCLLLCLAGRGECVEGRMGSAVAAVR